MGNQLFFNILLLCAILWQGIWALFEKSEKLSDTLVRKKRIIDNSPNPHLVHGIHEVPFIVNILKNGESFCGASILSPIILLTAAYCVYDDDASYIILSNSIFRNAGIPHHIERKYIYPHYNSTNMSNNLAVLVISPPIDLVNSHNRHIELYNRRGRRPTMGMLSGWGCSYLEGNRTIYPTTLRLIYVPILNTERCQNIYQNLDRVSTYDICTHDPVEQKRSCHGDVGGPLTTNGALLGVLSWSRVIPNRHTPDVYVNLCIPWYKKWVASFLVAHRG